MSERDYQYDFSWDNAAMRSAEARKRKAATMLAVFAGSAMGIDIDDLTPRILADRQRYAATYRLGKGARLAVARGIARVAYGAFPGWLLRRPATIAMPIEGTGGKASHG
jgi:hypothetical protein